jgi:transcriptional regulator with XRE-family HTH domain
MSKPRGRQAERFVRTRSGDARAFDKELGERIRARRKIAGMSMLDVAKEADISEGQISRYELGENGIPVETLSRLADILGCTLAQLVDRKG